MVSIDDHDSLLILVCILKMKVSACIVYHCLIFVFDFNFSTSFSLRSILRSLSNLGKRIIRCHIMQVACMASLVERAPWPRLLERASFLKIRHWLFNGSEFRLWFFSWSEKYNMYFYYYWQCSLWRRNR